MNMVWHFQSLGRTKRGASISIWPKPAEVGGCPSEGMLCVPGWKWFIEKSLGDAKGKQSNINIWTWILDDLKYFFPFTVSSMQDSVKGGVDDIFWPWGGSFRIWHTLTFHEGKVISEILKISPYHVIWRLFHHSRAWFLQIHLKPRVSERKSSSIRMVLCWVGLVGVPVRRCFLTALKSELFHLTHGHAQMASEWRGLRGWEKLGVAQYVTVKKG